MRALVPGEVVGGYRIERVLGRGGMGMVYEAVQLSLDRRVAFKVLAPDLSVDPQFALRFRREALIQASLTHPNIVTVHDAGEVDGMLYIVMRLIPGTTLKDLIAEGSISPPQLIKVLRDVAEGLDAAHADELVHRDVKPENILVRTGATRAYLADFGLTRLVSGSGFTAAGQFVGSVLYIAPEQIAGEIPTPAVDIYSLGAVLFEGLTGTPPFARASEIAVLFAHANEPAPRISALAPDLPSEIDAVVERAMAKDPSARYETAVELVDAAAAALDLTRDRHEH